MDPHATKTIIRMVMRPEGATLSQLVRATGWKRHSIRGFVSAVMRQHMGLRITRHDISGRYRLDIDEFKPMRITFTAPPPTRWMLFKRWMRKWFNGPKVDGPSQGR